MARFSGGWVKLHRKLNEHWIGNDGFALAIWDTLLRWASPEDRHTRLPKEGITLLKRGQIVTSAKQLADQLGFQRMTVERRLNDLEKAGTLVQQKSTHGRIITICNFDEYQSNEQDDCETDEQPDVQHGEQPRMQPREHLLKKARKQESKKEESTSASADSPASSAPNFLLTTWNAHRGALPQCRKLTDTLRRKCRARWTEEPNPAYWETCFKKMAASAFCTEGKWASFQWVMKNEDNHAKVTAGNYDNRDVGDNDRSHIDAWLASKQQEAAKQ